MGLLVCHPGLFTTVQDLGRPGYREWGVPAAGAFDVPSHQLANALLANGPDAATLELALIGGTYEAERPLALALAGAPMTAAIIALDGTRRTIQVPQSFSLETGERLELGHAGPGARTYLAVAGGWLTPLVLRSRSREEPLAAGERLPAEASTTLARRPQFHNGPWDRPEDPIRIVDGPDVAQLGENDPWPRLSFRVGATSNRMGLRLEGPELEVRPDPERLSSPVLPGAVQVAGLQPIILGVSSGTMGGYPHVAQVISADLPRLAQLRPGDLVSLQRVGLADARRLDRDDRRRRSADLLRTAALAADAREPREVWPGD